MSKENITDVVKNEVGPNGIDEGSNCPFATILWTHLHFPLTSISTQAEARRLGISRGAVRASLISSIFGEKGRNWLEKRGMIGF
jgi:hypothetical protein